MPLQRPTWRVLSDRLGARMAHHAFCEAHSLDDADPDGCPFCDDRAAYLEYEAAARPLTNQDFLVCDGNRVLRREPTREEALAWWKTNQRAPAVLDHARCGPGAYRYRVGTAAGAATRSITIVRVNQARRHGFDPDQHPLYPYARMPERRVPRTGEE
jgi:hypothetical protein